jgi:hypothetical protein
LVVGVNRYDRRGFAEKPLQYAERDVEALAVVLKQQGFDVRLLKGSSTGTSRATKAGIEAALTKVMARRNARDIVFVGFAGHGQQMPLLDDNGGEIKGPNGRPLEDAFFCPVDATVKKPETMISLSGLMRRLNDEGGINLVMVDACRDNPDPGRAGRSRAMSSMAACRRIRRSSSVVRPGSRLWKPTKPGVATAFSFTMCWKV